MLLLLIVILIIFFLYKQQTLKEDYIVPIDNANLSALARDSLQNPRLVDLSKVDWSKLTDSEYSELICQIEGCEERPIIKNLPIFK